MVPSFFQHTKCPLPSHLPGVVHHIVFSLHLLPGQETKSTLACAYEFLASPPPNEAGGRFSFRFRGETQDIIYRVPAIVRFVLHSSSSPAPHTALLLIHINSSIDSINNSLESYQYYHRALL